MYFECKKCADLRLMGIPKDEWKVPEERQITIDKEEKRAPSPLMTKSFFPKSLDFGIER
jgi:hypothetical protein